MVVALALGVAVAGNDIVLFLSLLSEAFFCDIGVLMQIPNQPPYLHSGSTYEIYRIRLYSRTCAVYELSSIHLYI